MARRVPEESREWLRRALRKLPEVSSFYVEPSEVELGGEAELYWSVENAELVTIEPDLGDVPSEGTQVIAPVRTTRYTVTACKGSETVREHLVLEVNSLRLAAPPGLRARAPSLLAGPPHLVAGPRAALRFRMTLQRIRRWAIGG